MYRNRHTKVRTATPLALVFALLACERAERTFEEIIEQRTPHEAYVATLRDAGALGTAVGRAWLAASDEALRTTALAEPPFREQALIEPERPGAIGYRVELRAGERVAVAVTPSDPATAAPFVDLFQVPRDTLAAPVRVASAPADSLAIRYEADADGAFVVRIQPELLRGGLYTVTITTEPALAFPLPDRDSRAIASYFGAPRDGGARDHHGVDIFAPRGTPVVAVTDGFVSGVRTTPRGGKVVWLRDERRRQSIYYAHLDAQLVENGTRVRMGDTLGTVGNSGNARTTSPHLHFGIYRRGRGPLNPYPFIHQTREAPPEPTAPRALLGEWTRVKASGAALRSGMKPDAPLLATFAAGTAARVTGIAGTRYRVALPDGREGYLAEWLLVPVDGPVERTRVRGPELVRSGPGQDDPPVDSVAPGEVPVLARFGGLALVEGAGGRRGWIRP